MSDFFINSFIKLSVCLGVHGLNLNEGACND